MNFDEQDYDEIKQLAPEGEAFRHPRADGTPSARVIGVLLPEGEALGHPA